MTDQKSLLEFLHGLNATLWESDARSRQFTFVSQGTEKALGYPVHQWLREPDFWIQHIHPDDRECAITSCFRAVAEGRDNEFEYRMVAADGRPVWLRDIVRIVRDEGGVPVGLHGVMVDITEHKQLEEQLRQAQKMEALGLLAGGVAHDFNNAMLAVLAWTELALQKTTADPPRRHFEKIQEQAQHAAGLSRQLLAFANHRALEPCRVNLNQTVTHVIGLLENTLGHGIRVETGLAPNLEHTWAVPTGMEQVLINLCLNARDAMPGGGRIVIETRNVDLTGDEARRHAGARPGRYVLLAVSDNGTGMNATTTKRISEPFFTTKQPGKARGLGLTVVYGIVKQHHGFIETYSEPDRGTTFRIYLLAAGRANVNKKDQLESNRQLSDI